MPVIKIWRLPKQTEDELCAIHKIIIETVVAIPELGLKDENDITVLFPSDMMPYGLGSGIIIEVVGLFDVPRRTDSVREQFAKNLVEAIQKIFPYAFVECFIYPFDIKQGFWSWKI